MNRSMFLACAQHGWLLTCANLGDSRAIVDTGREVTVLTDDHRVATHRTERRRLEKKGATIAPVDIGGTLCSKHGACVLRSTAGVRSLDNAWLVLYALHCLAICTCAKV